MQQQIKQKIEVNTMTNLIEKRNELQDALNTDSKKIKMAWKKYYREHRPYYKEMTVYGVTGNYKITDDCLDVCDHILYYALLGKDPKKMFAQVTIDNKKYIEYFKYTCYVFKSRLEIIFGIKNHQDDKVLLTKVIEYLKDYEKLI